jgi:hypothetical protein
LSRGRYGLAGLYRSEVPTRAEWLQNGWPNRDDQTITFTNGTETFEIAPNVVAYYDYYVEGRRHRSDGDTLVTDGTDGQHWIYYNAAGVLSALVNPTHVQVEDLIENQCLVAMVYWNDNTSEGYLFDERHGMSLSRDTHRMLHECVGMLWADGIAIDGIETDQSGANNSHAQFGNTSGEVYDEDVNHDIDAMTDPATYECWWWDGTRWQWDTNAGYPFLMGGSPRIQYNNFGAGTLVEVGNGNFALVHLFATSAEDGDPIIIVGQAEYTNITAAREGAASEVSTLLLATLPSPELKPIATVIFQSNNGYGNTPKTRARTASGGHDYTDWRTNPISPGGGTVSDHGSLGGLADDDHSGHPWLLGRSGGQILYGGIDAGDDLTLRSTSHATKGHVYLGTASAYDEVNDRLGIGILAPTTPLHVYGANASVTIDKTGGGTAVMRLREVGGAVDQSWLFQCDAGAGLFSIRDETNALSPFKLYPNSPANSFVIRYTNGRIGIGTAAPATSAKMELVSTVGALLLPRMTTAQRNALTAVNGMILYDSTVGAVYAREGGAWVNI